MRKSTIQTLEQSRADVQRIERKIALAQVMRGNILRGLEVAKAQIATSDADVLARYNALLGVRNTASVRALEAVKASLVSAQDHAAFDAIMQVFAATSALRTQALKDLAVDDVAGHAQFAFGPYAESAEKFSQAIDDFIVVQNQQLDVLVQQSDAQAERSTALGWGITALLLVLGIALARWLVAGMTAPLHQAVQLAERIGCGDLKVQSATARQDEFGQLLNALDAMAGQLRHVVGQVRTGVGGVVGSRANCLGQPRPVEPHRRVSRELAAKSCQHRAAQCSRQPHG